MPFSTTTHQRLRRLLYLQQALHLVWQSTPGWTIASVGLVIVQGGLPLLSLYLTKLIIDQITNGSVQAFGSILFLIAIAAIVALGSNLVNGLAVYVSTAQSQAVTDYVHDLLHAKSIALDLGYYENAQYYDALHQAQQEAPYRPTTILRQLIQGGQSAISLGAIALLLLSLHWAIALALFVAVLPGLVLRLKYTRRLYRKWMEWTPQERQASYLSWMLTHESYAKEVRLFNLGPLFQHRFHNLRQDIRQDKLRLARANALGDWVVQSGTTLAVFTAWGFMGYQTLLGKITLGSLVMYFQAFQQGQTYLQQVLSSLSGLYENSLFLANFYKFLNLESAVVEPSPPLAVPVPLRDGLRFERVSFSYPHRSDPVLEEVSFQIKAGETVALVGANGAGKTSLIKLLCRLYDPDRGRILLNGIDIRQFASQEFRRQISVVFQDYVHYNLTVRENIGLGKAGEIAELDEITQAAHSAGADRVIARLPQGYDTRLGNQFAEGVDLSIGEWQKIAIARAFLHPAPIVVLDEPTSALDAEAEFEVMEQFRQLTRDRTAILISHRLSTVKLADRILVLQGGRITESGSHEELMTLRGTYYQMFETQAQQYRC